MRRLIQIAWGVGPLAGDGGGWGWGWVGYGSSYPACVVGVLPCPRVRSVVCDASWWGTSTPVCEGALFRIVEHIITYNISSVIDRLSAFSLVAAMFQVCADFFLTFRASGG